MKTTLSAFILLLSIISQAQKSEYEVKTYLELGNKAPNTHHIGDAWLQFLVQADDDFEYNITQATFAADSTLDWHKHQTDQVIIVVDGKGYYQEKGKDVLIIQKGDVIRCHKGIEHWHTSTPDNDVKYIAIYGNSPTQWTEKLTKAYYDGLEKN